MAASDSRHPSPAAAAAAAAPAAPAAAPVLVEPLVILGEQPGLPRWDLPSALAAGYGAGLGFPRPCVYANFVASLDGVAALGPEHPSSGSTISGREPADRFVMGLLRACAGAVLLGAGTLRATPRHQWTSDHVYPQAAAEFAELRRRLRLPPQPELVVLTASGDLPAEHPALRGGAVIVTTAAGAARLPEPLHAACSVIELCDAGRLSLAAALEALRARGHEVVLSEAGPHLVGQMAAEGVLDELFLTVSPVLAGRATTRRDGLVAGLEFLPDQRVSAELLSTRQRGSYLFLRYRIGS